MKGILKRISLMALTLLSLSPFTYSQTAPLYKLYNQKDYPGILRELDNAEGDVKAVFQAASLRAYGDNEAAVKMLRSVRPSNDTLRFVQLTTLLYANVGRSDYSSALAAASERLSRYRTWIAPEDIVDDEEQLKILRIINGVPPMRVTKKADSRITLKKDLAGLANIPVKAADSLHSFVFDSGAGMSVISDSYARKLKFRVLGDSTVRIKSGSTGVYTAAKLAVADKIFIANVEMRNAVFLVFPDSALAFAGGRYVMNGIIGFPEISAMGEIALAGQELIVPAVTPKAKIRPNMIIEDYMPVVYLTYRGTELPFTFDTGASSSSISDNFYYRYKHLVE
ncbi:MAG TPA: retropepsin-like aspartic protease, partial [Sphingobacteriaceae bacterium]